MTGQIVDTAIILAGGLGTRLRAAVPDLPKPMAPIAGRPFLEYLLDYWAAQGIRRFILSVGHLFCSRPRSIGRLPSPQPLRLDILHLPDL